jgi:hypothetical protein
MSTETDINDDFRTFQNNPDKPIFHRLKFGGISFYLTKSCFHNDVATGENSHGYYRIFSWDDWRSQALLGLELGEENPKHGPVDLVGRFTPSEEDLKNVQYYSLSGRTFYRSARAFLEGGGHRQQPELIRRGDEWSEFRMEEIIPTGVQGKAIYGEGNYIIDGPAGTGKSTTAIQKLKLLTKNSGVEPTRLLVVVRTKELMYEVQQLLSSLDLASVRISSIDTFISEESGYEGPALTSAVRETWGLAESIHALVAEMEEDVARLSKGIFGQSSLNVSEPTVSLSHDKYSVSLMNEYRTERDSLLEFYRRKKTDRKARSEKIAMQLARFRSQERERIFKRRARKSSGQSKDTPSDAELRNGLSFNDENELKKKVDQHKSLLERDFEKWRSEVARKLSLRRGQLKRIEEKLRDRLTKEEFSSLKFTESSKARLFNLQVRKLLGSPTPFHTIVLDEAQNASQSDIHVLWAFASNLILTGDEMQSGDEGVMNGWRDLGFIENSFRKHGKLNIYTLKNNFRQTFELGSCSHNFRQLMLDRPMVDISDEYFENQKGFPKPRIARIRQQSDFADLAARKVQFAKEAFSDPPSVVIFYENKASRDRVAGALDQSDIRYAGDGDESRSVMLVSLSAIAGRSFPIVLAPLLKNSSDQAVYTMLSRARFDLTLFVGEGRPVNRKISALRAAGLIGEFEFN